MSSTTRQSGLYYAAHQLARRGWTVVLPVPGTRETTITVANEDGSATIAIKARAVAGKDPTGLGSSLETLTAPWWIITTDANSDAPTSYIMTLDEVKAVAHDTDPEKTAGGKVKYFLQPNRYAKPEYKEAWGRLGDPTAKAITVTAA